MLAIVVDVGGEYGLRRGGSGGVGEWRSLVVRVVGVGVVSVCGGGGPGQWVGVVVV